jgi:hypothetical protein
MYNSSINTEILMHIELNLKVTVGDETRSHVMEALRTKLRHMALQYVFEAAEAAGIHHRDINVDGDIKLVETK